MTQAPTPGPLSKYANDKAAKALYDSWSSLNGWVPWVERGNSDMQEHARRLATRSEALSDLAALDGETMDFAPIAPVETAPGHTDLMVSPESIDAFLEANPPPVETLGETAWDDVDIEDLLSDAIGDSIDLGWSSRDGAKAALAALKKEGLLIFPTQPDTGKVEASGVELADAVARTKEHRDRAHPNHKTMFANIADLDLILSFLRPQPSGETREGELLREMRGLFNSEGYLFCSGDYQLEVIARVDALITPADQAKGGEG